jgi:hypothetical protein
MTTASWECVSPRWSTADPVRLQGHTRGELPSRGEQGCSEGKSVADGFSGALLERHGTVSVRREMDKVPAPTDVLRGAGWMKLLLSYLKGR